MVVLPKAAARGIDPCAKGLAVAQLAVAAVPHRHAVLMGHTRARHEQLRWLMGHGDEQLDRAEVPLRKLDDHDGRDQQRYPGSPRPWPCCPGR